MVMVVIVLAAAVATIAVVRQGLAMHVVTAVSLLSIFEYFIGNGAIQLFHFEGKKKFTIDEQLKNHSQGVSQVHFPKFDPNGILISGGNDSKLVLWNLKGRQCNGHHNVTEKSPCSVLHEVDHGSKVNWVTSGSLTKKLVFVADQTNNISVYELQH